MEELTARQKAIYDFIVNFREAHGCSPSIPEIQKAFLIRSPNGVAGHLLALETKGWIRRSKRGSRQIDLVAEDSGHEARPSIFILPVYRGAPSTAAARADETISLDSAALGFDPPEGSFAIRVADSQMAGAGILRDDMVVVEPLARRMAGQIVAASIGAAVALRRLVQSAGRWQLETDGSDRPIPESEATIHGVVRTVVRRMG